MQEAANVLSTLSPKKYHLHNRIGGEGWHIDRQRPPNEQYEKTRITLDETVDDSVITYLLLKA